MKLTSRQALLLRVFSGWTIWVWSTRIWNIVRDDHAVGFKVVHAALAAVSVALAVGGLVVVSRNRRTAEPAEAAPHEHAAAS